MRRGYLTRSGLGLLVGVAALGACLVLAGLTPGGIERVSLASGVSAPGFVGPFRATIERFEVHPDPVTGSGRPRALVQLHLERPGGPVPVEERVRIDGTGSLGPSWLPVGVDWLLKNEYVQLPRGDVLHHPYLGDVPATRHAGEVRAVFEFVWFGERLRPSARANFTFRLPDGGSVTFYDVARTSR